LGVAVVVVVVDVVDVVDVVLQLQGRRKINHKSRDC
jgi:hypothetical protein